MAVTGARFWRLVLFVALFSLFDFLHGACPTDWTSPTVVKLQNTQYEVRFSGNTLRIFALMPSGRAYEEEFAQFELV